MNATVYELKGIPISCMRVEFPTVRQQLSNI